MGSGNDSILDMYLYETNTLLEQLDGILLAAEQADTFSQDSVNEIFSGDQHESPQVFHAAALIEEDVDAKGVGRIGGQSTFLSWISSWRWSARLSLPNPWLPPPPI